MPTTPEDCKELARRGFELWNTGNLALADDLYPAEYKRYDFDTLHEGRGPEFVKGLLTMYRTAFPDLQLTIEEMIVADDIVISRWRSTATHQGEFQGQPPTGKTATVTGVTIMRMADGKIIEECVYMDSFKLMQVVGAVPA